MGAVSLALFFGSFFSVSGITFLSAPLSMVLITPVLAVHKWEFRVKTMWICPFGHCWWSGGDLSYNKAQNTPVCLGAQNLIQIILFPSDILTDSIIFPHSIHESVLVRQGRAQDLPVLPLSQGTICFKTLSSGRRISVIIKISVKLNSVCLRMIIILKQPSWDSLLTENQFPL